LVSSTIQIKRCIAGRRTRQVRFDLSTKGRCEFEALKYQEVIRVALKIMLILRNRSIMAEKFKNKYRIESARLKNWDYGRNASYFVTMCTKNRIYFFGHVIDDEMILNDIGLIADDCWLQIPEHFPFVKLGEHVVMPNHVHGIVTIDKPDDGRHDGDDGACTVETQNFASLRPPGSKNKFGPQSKNLASIIRGFKIGVTTKARLINPGFVWQSRYHDHIIRDNESFERISEYIKNNPANWKEDKFY
jgi:REP element-mobilizing transposase RayT